MLASKKKRHLGVENLEGRALLAGDVSIDVVNGNLIIRGDEADNSVSIAAGALAGEYVVTGLTTTNGDTTFNGTADTVFNASGVTGDIDIRLRDGEDALAIGAIEVADDLNISMGDDDDTVTLAAGISVGDKLSINTDGGDDTITSAGATVGGSAHVKAGSGDDTVSLTNWLVENDVEEEADEGESLDNGRGLALGHILRELLGGGLGRGFGSHNDDGQVEVDLGSGDDSLTVSGLTATKFSLYGGSGDDDATLSGLVVDRLHADLGSGDDSLAVSASTIDRMMANLGSGDDELTLAGSTAVATSLTINGGPGTDSLIDDLASEPLDLFRRGFESIV